MIVIIVSYIIFKKLTRKLLESNKNFESNRSSLTDFRRQMRSGNLPAYLSLNGPSSCLFPCLFRAYFLAYFRVLAVVFFYFD